MICDFGRVKGVFRTGPWLHDTWWKPYKVIVHKGGIEDEQVSTSSGNTVCSWLFLCVFKSSSIIQKHVKERHMRKNWLCWYCDFQSTYSHIIITDAAFQFHEVHIFKKADGGGIRLWRSTAVAESLRRMRSKKGGVHRNDMFSLKVMNLVVSNIFFFHPYLGKIPILTNIFQMGWNHQLVMNLVKVHPKFQVPKIGGTEHYWTL